MCGHHKCFWPFWSLLGYLLGLRDQTLTFFEKSFRPIRISAILHTKNHQNWMNDFQDIHEWMDISPKSYFGWPIGLRVKTNSQQELEKLIYNIKKYMKE